MISDDDLTSAHVRLRYARDEDTQMIRELHRQMRDLLLELELERARCRRLRRKLERLRPRTKKGKRR